MDELLPYKIAISLLPRIGNALARNLIAYAGGIREALELKPAQLQKVPGIGSVLAKNIASTPIDAAVDKELRFIEKHRIRPLFFLDKDYPERLKHCEDAPVMLYVKGGADLSPQRAVSIVGTRSATQRGLDYCKELVAAMAGRQYPVAIYSGLAYGIDICAHRAALEHKLPTVAVLGHGMHTLYPAAHRNEAAKILREGGALLTEYTSQSQSSPRSFLQRNRIVAGLSDVTIVVESGEKGGALVTADIAMSYNRDVLAFPGRPTDTYSRGTNKLIKQNKAALIESIEDLEYVMDWQSPDKPKPAQQQKLLLALTEEEQKITDVLKSKGKQAIDILCLETGMPMSKVSALLLNLEFNGLVKTLPGKQYELA